MGSSIKVIRFTIRAAIVGVILTYLVSLNISYGWFDLKWLSNNFLLTVFGGAFASMLVVMICEFQKYFESKTSTEISIFYNASWLYGQLLILKNLIQKMFDSPKDPMATGMFAQTEHNIKMQLSTFRQIEYATFSKRSSLLKNFYLFRFQTIPNIEKIIINFRNLDTAIVTDKLNSIKTFGAEQRITSNSPNTGKALKIQYRDLVYALDEVDSFMALLDAECNGLFKWAETKAGLLQAWENEPEFSFEAFISQEVNL